MKHSHRVVGFLLVAFLSVIANPTHSIAQSQELNNEQIIRNFITAWSALDVDELVSYFSVDGTYYNMPTSPVTGQENLKQFIAGFIRAWESTDWEVLNLIAKGDIVVAERIDHTVVAGSPVDLPAFGIFEMENGKIKIWRDYFNLPTYSDAMAAALQ
jgi:limonene-1,2-epoxide hydrolase